MKSERIVVFIILLFVVVFTTADLIADIDEGASLFHLFGEGFVTLSSLAATIWFGMRAFHLRKQVIRQTDDIARAEAEARRWKDEASSVLSGFGQAIDRQFDRWKMTAAEKEVGLLLLKGLSLKDVADVRGVSEKTVRAQSLAIYSKSGLAGRAELSAFFLEDILLPQRELEKNI